MTLKKDQYACKGGPGTYFFLPGKDLPTTIRYPEEAGFDGSYRKVHNPDTGITTYVWEKDK